MYISLSTNVNSYIGPYKIAKCNANWELYFEKNLKTVVPESVQCAPWAGLARKVYNGFLRPGRSEAPPGSERRRPAAGPSTPSFRLTPAFGLCSLRKNGYFPDHVLFKLH